MSKTLTATEVQAVIGTVGQVVHPGKGPWEGQWRVTGCVLDPADPDTVTGLSVESLERVPEKTLYDEGGVVVNVVAEHAKHVAPDIPVSWWRPNAA